MHSPIIYLQLSLYRRDSWQKKPRLSRGWAFAKFWAHTRPLRARWWRKWRTAKVIRKGCSTRCCYQWLMFYCVIKVCLVSRPTCLACVGDARHRGLSKTCRWHQWCCLRIDDIGVDRLINLGAIAFYRIGKEKKRTRRSLCGRWKSMGAIVYLMLRSLAWRLWASWQPGLKLRYGCNMSAMRYRNGCGYQIGAGHRAWDDSVVWFLYVWLILRKGSNGSVNFDSSWPGTMYRVWIRRDRSDRWSR